MADSKTLGVAMKSCETCKHEFESKEDNPCMPCLKSGWLKGWQAKGVTGIEAMVCKDIADRQALGIKKYGVTVADNPLKLKEWLNHAYEETLDNAVYLRRAIAEIEKTRN